MKCKIGDVDPAAARRLPPHEADASGVGVNYLDAYLKPLKATLEDGRKVAWKRRGLKVTLTVGDARGEGLLRRLEHGPAELDIVRAALEEAARGVEARFLEEDGSVYLEW